MRRPSVSGSQGESYFFNRTVTVQPCGEPPVTHGSSFPWDESADAPPCRRTLRSIRWVVAHLAFIAHAGRSRLPRQRWNTGTRPVSIGRNGRV